MDFKPKGVAMFGFAIGLIVLFVGVALAYMVPEYVIGALNATGQFCLGYNTTPAECVSSSATCCVSDSASVATTQAGQVRSLGFVVIVISVVWMLISIINKE